MRKDASDFRKQIRDQNVNSSSATSEKRDDVGQAKSQHENNHNGILAVKDYTQNNNTTTNAQLKNGSTV